MEEVARVRSPSGRLAPTVVPFASDVAVYLNCGPVNIPGRIKRSNQLSVTELADLLKSKGMATAAALVIKEEIDQEALSRFTADDLATIGFLTGPRAFLLSLTKESTCASECFDEVKKDIEELKAGQEKILQALLDCKGLMQRNSYGTPLMSPPSHTALGALNMHSPSNRPVVRIDSMSGFRMSEMSHLSEHKSSEMTPSKSTNLETVLSTLPMTPRSSDKIMKPGEIAVIDAATASTMEVVRGPEGSTTSISHKIHDSGAHVLQASVPDSYRHSSYGEFTVAFKDDGGKVLHYQKVTVQPSAADMLPTTLQTVHATRNDGVEATVYLVRVENDARSIVATVETDKGGACTLPEVPDGTYEIIIDPSERESDLSATVVCKVVYAGLRTQASQVEVKRLLPGISKYRGIPMLEGTKFDPSSATDKHTHDLVLEGGLLGTEMVLVLLYPGPYDSFETELKRLGIKLNKFHGCPPLKAFKDALARSCQLWIISNSAQKLSEEHYSAVQQFWQCSNGLFLWGDNEPYFKEANILARRLLHAELKGNEPGQEVVGMTQRLDGPGLQLHDVTTGVPHLFEGSTISWISSASGCRLKTLVRSSTNKPISAYYDSEGRRALLDGGFTRLFDSYWNTEGTARFVSNCVGWLANVEVRRPAVDALYAAAP